MKKLYISCPMKGRTIEEIEKSRDKMHRIAEAVFDQDLELIDIFVSVEPPANNSIALWNLGENIKKMAKADYFVGVDSWEWRGCSVERSIAETYIPHVSVLLLSPEQIGIKRPSGNLVRVSDSGEEYYINEYGERVDERPES